MSVLRTSLLLLAGLAGGFAVAAWLRPASEPAAGLEAASPSAALGRPHADAEAAARLAAVEAALDAEIVARAALEEHVAELAARLEGLAGPPAPAPGPPGRAGEGPDPSAIAEMRARFRADPAARSEEAERRFVERLAAEGFAPDRAAWIVRRTEELRMEALQAQYDAQREGRSFDPGAAERTLRSELGDSDYERYLRASGRPTTVPVRDVLASSPAERSGLEPGDEIVAYAGERVFDMRELTARTLEGTPGESVVVEVRRNGQSLQLVLPRGPIGITGGGLRGR